ncbi:hypothetical protein XELAEV_18027029mg [Xenopus laevis]|uniref:Uncharacterized protein n=1 Tax=Xenopus laevis TaxID=8355 RepID=A0A974CVI5_XENLA|nr:hypothetical protein XELAEV_18027029mg [Xenopus laevis]
MFFLHIIYLFTVINLLYVMSVILLHFTYCWYMSKSQKHKLDSTLPQGQVNSSVTECCIRFLIMLIRL